jgi:hypothetical protein
LKINFGNLPKPKKEDMTMTTMINPNANCRKRASLNEQINRLDGMLEGLSEALNEAVAEAVKSAVGTAVKESVQAVLTEVLTNPQIRAKLRSEALAHDSLDTAAFAAPQTPRVAQPLNSWWQRTRACIASLGAACAGPLRHLRISVANIWQRTHAQLTALWASRDMIRPFKNQILMALAIGVLVGVSVWYAGPWIAAIISGIGGFATTLTVQAGLWLRNVLAVNAEQAA